MVIVLGISAITWYIKQRKYFAFLLKTDVVGYHPGPGDYQTPRCLPFRIALYPCVIHRSLAPSIMYLSVYALSVYAL